MTQCMANFLATDAQSETELHSQSLGFEFIHSVLKYAIMWNELRNGLFNELFYSV